MKNKTNDFIQNHSNQESQWRELWEQKHIFKFDKNSLKPLYSIDAPPPTVSGKLHLGHVFSYTQADVIARYHRLIGENVYNPFCIDNNGLPTERLMMNTEGLDPEKLGLEEFYNQINKKLGDYEKQYEDLFRAMGFSYDYSLKYSSIDKSIQRMTQETFLDLQAKGIIYRKDAPALYCPECKTAIAQAEVEDREFDAIFYDIQFTDQSGKAIMISTTRPEFLPACDAICINPKDKKANELLGTQITTPLGIKVPVFADEKALLDKGTGIVMVCSYGDETDLSWIRNNSLTEKIIIDHNGKTCNTELAGMDGLTIQEAREFIIKYLNERNLITAEKEIRHSIGTHERCHTPIEIIPVKQWFVKTLEYKEQILKLSEKVKFYPKYFEKRFRHWVEGLKWDWCISRERYYGIPIPVYYCSDCENQFFPDQNELPIDPRYTYKNKTCPKCNSNNILPETGVLDTWFTSGQSPDINGYWPMSMRTQAHDNIRVWSFYSMVFGVIKHNNVVPWHELMTAGHLLVKKGEKISKKSDGGAYDSYKIASDNSVDALRFAMSLARLGKDAYYEEDNINRGRKLITKLINSYRFVLMNLKGYSFEEIEFKNLHSIDRWILNKYSAFFDRFTKNMKSYEGGLALQEFENFFWKEFCDTYLELSKNRLNGTDLSLKKSSQYTLHLLMLEILKIASIFLPYIAEELFHSNLDQGELYSDIEGGYYKSICNKSSIFELQSGTLPYGKDDRLDSNISLLNEVITQMRKLKIDKNLKLSTEISILRINGGIESVRSLKEYESEIKYFSRSKDIEYVGNSKLSDLSVEILL